jgi:gluconolactonase
MCGAKAAGCQDAGRGWFTGRRRGCDVVANFTFGGAKRNQLFICATSAVYSILVNFNGARYPR